MSHLHEMVIGSARVWLELADSCESTVRAGASFECRCNRYDCIKDAKPAVTAFKGFRALRLHGQRRVHCDPAPGGMGRRRIPH